ncbi:MAG: hypothetical protein QNJ51_24760 [Calothrix sp. MO_167.B12]|nr:hypothetical protein [Calothrix sp. MO_167.B12]
MARLLGKKKRTVNTLTTLAIAAFGLHLLTLILLVFQGLTIRQLNARKPPTFVQLVDGQLVNKLDNLTREPEKIRQFVSKTMMSMFDWSGKLPPQTVEQVSQPQTDGGILIRTTNGSSKRVATSSWLASFALSEDFRQGFLSTIAEMTPTEVFSSNARQAISAKLAIKRVDPPQQIAPGEWRVSMVADLIQKKRSDDTKVIVPFNKDLLVRAIDTFDYPLPQRATNLQKAIYSVRTDKLEIYEMRDLCLVDKYEGLPTNQLSSCNNRRTSGNFIR